MCTCASCSYTDSFAGKGFAAWPRGEPAGRRSSERDYAAHVRHSWLGARKRTELPEFYSVPAGMTRAQVQEVLRRTFEEKASPVLPEPARPAQPGKAGQHLPELDRQPGPGAVIYAMRKEKENRPVGRPPLPGRRVVIKLEEEQIKRAAKLGEGNVAAGIRKALEKVG